MRYLSFRSATAYESVGAIIDGHIVDLAAMLPDETSGLSPIRRLLLAWAGSCPRAWTTCRVFAASTRGDHGVATGT